MTDNKQFTTIDGYISSFPADIQVILERIRQTIHKAVPEATEIISYNMPTFDLNGNHLIFFAGWKHHISLHPIPAGDEAFQQKISHFKKEKSTLRFSLGKPIPYDLIEQVATFLAKESPERDS